MWDHIQYFWHQAMLSIIFPAFELLRDGRARYWSIYLLAGLGIAYTVYALKGETVEFRKRLNSKDVWLSRSAANDYLIVFFSPFLRLAVFSWAFLNPAVVSGWVVNGLEALGVHGQVNDGAAVAAGFALTVAIFLVDDFLRFYLHYLFHKHPVLWEFHKVHHSASSLNFFTSERTHPVEEIAFTAGVALGVGAVNGLFIAFFGNHLTVTTVAGANVFLFLANMVGGALRHSPFWVSYPPFVERFLISPAMHQIHHSAEVKHYDTNMGGSLSIWDHIWGTALKSKGVEIKELGIGEETKDYQKFSALMLLPFIRAGRLLSGRKEGKPYEAAAPVSAAR